VAELRWLFGDLLENFLPDDPSHHRHRLQRGQAPATLAGVAVEVQCRIGVPLERGQLAAVADALTDAAQWEQLDLSQ
jgi:hypothetical protein